MTRKSEPRRSLQASGTADFIGLEADRDRAAEATAGLARRPDRHGPLRTGRFTVELDGTELEGVRSIALAGRRSVTAGGSGGGQWGQTTFDDLDLERELRVDDSRLLEWRRAVEAGKADEGRKELTVTLMDETGDSKYRWEFTDAWPRTYHPPVLDTSGDEIATVSLRIAVGGVERIIESASEALPASPTTSGVFRFVNTVNDGRIDDGATAVIASDIGIEAVTLDGMTPELTIDGEHATVVVPEGQRSASDGNGRVLWLLSGKALQNRVSESVQIDDPDSNGGPYWVGTAEFFHGSGWQPPGRREGNEGSPAREIPGWPAGTGSDTEVLLFTGEETIEQTFGTDPEATGEEAPEFRPATAGESIDPESTVFAVLGGLSDAAPLRIDGSGPDGIADIFDTGRPVPLAGAGFGLATLSTPDASLARQSVNPIVEMDTTELLQSEAAREVLKRAGVTDADTVEWQVGPREIEVDDRTVRLLENDTPLQSFGGVVNGRAGPWLVTVHVARRTLRDHVVAAGVYRHPIGTDGGIDDVPGWRDVIERSRTLTIETGGQLEYLD